MIKVTVPATSANLACGFDSCGIALNLFNEFCFKQTEKTSFIHFDEEFSSKNTNLVYKAFLHCFEYANKKVIEVEITANCNIPHSRGLGSSSSCIIAGLLAANYYLNDLFSKEEIFSLATKMEGHPDNVAPALYGGLCASFIDMEQVYTCNYEVNEELIFNIFSPAYPLETSLAREVIPTKITLSDAIYNLSRTAFLPKVFKEGDLFILKKVLKDRLHQPYRAPLISDYAKLEKFADTLGLPFCISGAGSSMMIISKEQIYYESNMQHYQLKLATGAFVEEINISI